MMKSFFLGWKVWPLVLVASGALAAGGGAIISKVAQVPVQAIGAPVQEALGLSKNVTAIGMLTIVVGLVLHYQDRASERTSHTVRLRDTQVGEALLAMSDSTAQSAKESRKSNERIATENRSSVSRLHLKTETSHRDIRDQSQKHHDEIMEKVVAGLQKVHSAVLGRPVGGEGEEIGGSSPDLGRGRRRGP